MYDKENAKCETNIPALVPIDLYQIMPLLYKTLQKFITNPFIQPYQSSLLYFKSMLASG